MLLIFAIPFSFTNVVIEETGSVIENELNIDESILDTVSKCLEKSKISNNFRTSQISGCPILTESNKSPTSNA